MSKNHARIILQGDGFNTGIAEENNAEAGEDIKPGMAVERLASKKV